MGLEHNGARIGTLSPKVLEGTHTRTPPVQSYTLRRWGTVMSRRGQSLAHSWRRWTADDTSTRTRLHPETCKYRHSGTAEFHKCPERPAPEKIAR